MAAAFGLPKEEALKAVTLYPAQIFGVADRFGSIEPGKRANLAALHVGGLIVIVMIVAQQVQCAVDKQVRRVRLHRDRLLDPVDRHVERAFGRQHGRHEPLGSGPVRRDDALEPRRCPSDRPAGRSRRQPRVHPHGTICAYTPGC